MADNYTRSKKAQDLIDRINNGWSNGWVGGSSGSTSNSSSTNNAGSAQYTPSLQAQALIDRINNGWSNGWVGGEGSAYSQIVSQREAAYNKKKNFFDGYDKLVANYNDRVNAYSTGLRHKRSTRDDVLWYRNSANKFNEVSKQARDLLDSIGDYGFNTAEQDEITKALQDIINASNSNSAAAGKGGIGRQDVDIPASESWKARFGSDPNLYIADTDAEFSNLLASNPEQAAAYAQQHLGRATENLNSARENRYTITPGSLRSQWDLNLDNTAYNEAWQEYKRAESHAGQANQALQNRADAAEMQKMQEKYDANPAVVRQQIEYAINRAKGEISRLDQNLINTEDYGGAMERIKELEDSIAANERLLKTLDANRQTALTEERRYEISSEIVPKNLREKFMLDPTGTITNMPAAASQNGRLQYISEAQKNTYFRLKEEEGQTRADEYLDAIWESLGQMESNALAQTMIFYMWFYGICTNNFKII